MDECVAQLALEPQWQRMRSYDHNMIICGSDVIVCGRGDILTPLLSETADIRFHPLHGLRLRSSDLGVSLHLPPLFFTSFYSFICLLFRHLPFAIRQLFPLPFPFEFLLLSAWLGFDIL